jgi:hypothetical protein
VGAQFRHGQAEAIVATDFFTVDLLDGTSAYVLALIEHATRRIRSSASPHTPTTRGSPCGVPKGRRPVGFGMIMSVLLRLLYLILLRLDGWLRAVGEVVGVEGRRTACAAS